MDLIDIKTVEPKVGGNKLADNQPALGEPALQIAGLQIPDQDFASLVDKITASQFTARAPADVPELAIAPLPSIPKVMTKELALNLQPVSMPEQPELIPQTPETTVPATLFEAENVQDIPQAQPNQNPTVQNSKNRSNDSEFGAGATPEPVLVSSAKTSILAPQNSILPIENTILPIDSGTNNSAPRAMPDNPAIFSAVTAAPSAAQPQSKTTPDLPSAAPQPIKQNSAPSLISADNTRVQNPASDQLSANILRPTESPVAAPVEVKIASYPQGMQLVRQAATPTAAVQKTPNAITAVQSGAIDSGLPLFADSQSLQFEPARINPAFQSFEKPSLTPIDSQSLNAAKNVAQQISVQISKTADPRIEIRLDPPELGRVTVSMVTTDHNIQALITAERPEIVDLMRRHADILSAALEKAGFGQADLQFQSGQQQDQKDQNQNENLARMKNLPPSETEIELTYIAGKSLDIRL